MKRFIYGILGFLFAVTIACAVKYGVLDVQGLKSNGEYLQVSPSVSMVYKDAATITVQSGVYYIGGKYLKLSANTDWSWDLDTGTEDTSGLVWYYLYTYDNSGTPDHIGSLTAPTALFDTDLSGETYDTNQYLGAVVNSSGNFVKFWQVKNRFGTMDLTDLTFWENTSDSSYTDFDLITNEVVPASASFVDLAWCCDGQNAYLSLDDSTQFMLNSLWTCDEAMYVNQAPYLTMVPMDSGQVYIKRAGGVSSECRVATGSWIDKWIH